MSQKTKCIIAFFITAILIVVSYFLGKGSIQKSVTSDISDDSLNNINIASYFPVEGNELIYATYNDKGEIYSTSNQIITSVEESENSKIYCVVEKVSAASGDTSRNVDFENDITYSVNANSIEQTKAINIGGTGFTNSNHVILLKNKHEWDMGDPDNTHCKITGINQTITTKVGKFANCIEILEEVKVNNNTISTQNYYAPNVGLVLIKYKENSNFIIFKELTNINSNKVAQNDTTESMQQQTDSNVGTSLDAYNNSLNPNTFNKNKNQLKLNLTDENGETFYVSINCKNGKVHNAADNFSDFCALEGDIIWDGNFTISYGKSENSTLPNEELINYISDKANDNHFTFNVNRNEVYIYKGNYLSLPNLLVVEQPETSELRTIQIYYIKSNKLIPVTFISNNGKNKYCDTYCQFFNQVSDNEIETSAYDNTEGIFYITKWNFNKSKGEFKEISNSKISNKDYENYVSAFYKKFNAAYHQD